MTTISARPTTTTALSSVAKKRRRSATSRHCNNSVGSRMVSTTMTSTIETVVAVRSSSLRGPHRRYSWWAAIAATVFATTILTMTHPTAEAWASSSSSTLLRLAPLSSSSSSGTTLQLSATVRTTSSSNNANRLASGWMVAAEDAATDRRTNEPLLFENYEASLYASQYDTDDEYLLNEDEMNLIGGTTLDTVQKLQQQEGNGVAGGRRQRRRLLIKNDVLSTQEQALVDQSDAADTFLVNFGGTDVSHLEKIAMGSIPAQLPQAPLGAFLEKKMTTVGDGTKDTNLPPSMQYSKQRVSVEQEQQLGRLIQAGAKVVQIKDTLQASLGREPTKHEWAKAAGLDSPKELRRTVAAYRSAKHMLVTANMGLVHSIVRRSRPRHDGISTEELIQEGSLGLLRAAELFDPTKGLRFSTYAVVWIKGMLANTHVGEFVRLPDRERTKWNKINEAAVALQAQDRSMPGMPSGEALAAYTGLPIHDVLYVVQHMKQLQSHYMVSLDARINHHQQARSTQSTSLYESISYDDEGLAEQAQFRAEIIATLTRNLTPREARLMRLRYGLTDGQSRSMQQCADAMGLSLKVVRGLDKKCLVRLRQAVDAKALEEYLMAIS